MFHLSETTVFGKQWLSEFFIVAEAVIILILQMLRKLDVS